jgi:cytochrome c-type biogenesis protein CcmH/NrfG
VIPNIDELRAGRTLAEIQGFTEELGVAVASLAAREAGSGDLEVARGILEGLVVTNPRDALAWALLSQVERRRGDPFTALLCAEAAARLLPEDRQVRLARAEALLALPSEVGTGGAMRREVARGDLEALQSGADEVARRAGALLRALGPC